MKRRTFNKLKVLHRSQTEAHKSMIVCKKIMINDKFKLTQVRSEPSLNWEHCELSDAWNVFYYLEITFAFIRLCTR